MKLGTYNYSTGEAFDLAGVLLGTFPNGLEARRAMYAARLPVEFWFAETIPPIPLLQQLNDWVIQQNEKRLPKWKFRFAPDLAIQIQSKLTRKHAVLFEGVAIRTENLSAKRFTEPKTLEGSAFWKLAFGLFCGSEDPTVWHFKAKSVHRGHGCVSSRLVELRRQIIDALHPERFAHLSPDRMLCHACLCCGKGLTDPASMARWIGPECWGSASINAPRLFKAETAGGRHG
jgi:Family of unknown function (DUF6011)